MIRTLLVFAALGLSSACSQSSRDGGEPAEADEAAEPTRGGDHERATVDPPEGAPEKAPPAPRGTNANYEITTSPQGAFKVGDAGRVDVRLVGRNGYHVNQEYPIQLTLQPVEGAKLAKTKLVRADATTFEEAQAVFGISLTPESAGRKALHGTLNFSVCNPVNCLLERQDVNAEFEAAAN